MAESACLMQPFSHSSDATHEPKEGNPIRALSESISFGRFMSESLAWEKWSSFNHNRYLEEVEKYSRPGSVAQKKAYFEAHYKRIAEQKAAALLEQANAAAAAAVAAANNNNNVAEIVTDGADDGGDPDAKLDGLNCQMVAVDQPGNAKLFNAETCLSTDANDDLDSEFDESNCNVAFDEAVVDTKVSNAETCLSTDANDYLDSEFDESNCNVAFDEAVVDTKVSNAETCSSTDASYCNSHCESGRLETTKVEEADPVREDPVLVVIENPLKIESPNQHSDVENECKVTEMENSIADRTQKPPLKEILSSNQEPSALTTKVKKPVASSSKSSVSYRASLIPSPPARPRTPAYSRKENNATPNSKKSTMDSVDRKRSTPKSLHMSINFMHSPSPASETNKMSSPIVRKIGESRVASSSTKTSKDCLTPIRTPAKVITSTNGLPKLLPVNFQLETKRTKTPLGNTATSRKADMKCQSLSIEPSNSSSTCRNKAWSLVVSSSFSFRSDERAAKRKEYFQKLEEKFNADEAQKKQLQAKSKEKDETELKKLRQSLGFKAKPMPDFYRETGSPKSQIKKKVPLTRPRSPKLGRKPSPSAVQNTNSLPPRRPSSVKSDGSKHAMEKTKTQTRSVASQPIKNAHENASPNIQS